MIIGILAPVPANILKSAQETCAKAGRIVFGSNAREMFDKANRQGGEGLPVLIYPTNRYGDPDNVCDPGYATFRGVYLGTKIAQAGQHPNPTVRPLPTIEEHSPDTAWALFWEVGDLREIPMQDRVAIASLTAEGRTKPFAKDFLPRGPMLVEAAFL